ncbi:hypothetical protein BZL30_3692 [Mycobacterium kansasii]|uniref:Uncharacterized protein n=1 Tax=Mycobacterium kansasii TaxID=1768 RepID=A0A1V3XBD4_MYCKA|nr:hypothetical protein BZL30_3692 [Mycobacterium kansasii]
MPLAVPNGSALPHAATGHAVTKQTAAASVARRACRSIPMPVTLS